MTKEEINNIVKEKCPEMLSHDNFMYHMYKNYLDEELSSQKDIVTPHYLTNEEYKVYSKITEHISTATIGYLIKYLQTNFKPDDKLCYMDYVQGMRDNCEYLTKDKLGETFFYTVLNLKKAACEANGTTMKQEDLHPYVNDNDVILH